MSMDATKYKPYPAYKDSGVEWLGEVPEHWEVLSLRRVASLAYGDSLAEEIRAEGEVPVFGSNGRVGWHSESNTKEPLIIIGRKGSFGKITYSEKSGFCIDTTYFIDPRYTQTNMRWLYYAMQPLGLDEISQDTGVPGLSREKAYEKRLALPPATEQQAITTFLDRETAKIDTLIAKQERLIELLQEKRTALISHAVTKGINPDAPMKDSGVEWLGEVPAHWEVYRLWSFVELIQTGPFGSQLHAEDYIDDGIPVINPANLKENKIVSDSTCCVSNSTADRLSRYRLFPGDIIFGRRGELGRCALIRKSEEGWLCGTGSLLIRTNVKRSIPEFLLRVLSEPGVKDYLSLMSVGATIDNLNTNILGNIRCPLPPINEQKAIALFLSKETIKFDTLITKARHTIDLLKERRTALISAAVTGKIDVRETA